MIPKVNEARAESFRPASIPAVVIGKSLAGVKRCTYEPLVKALEEHYGAAVSTTLAPGQMPDSPYILVGLTGDDAALEQLVADLPPAAQVQIHREGYVIDITAERVLVAAVSLAGAAYGVQTLVARMSGQTRNVDIDAGRIVDWPTMSRRGFHFLVKSRKELPDFESIITEYMPRLRLNELILEINYHYEYESHPEVREEECWTAEDCRRLKRLADANCVKIIPMINCLGHQSWADETFQLLRAHPEFDETPEIPLNNKEIYCRSWCPHHPEVNGLIFDLIDEIVDVFEADAFHAGMDEVFILGRCPRCRGTEPAVLFAKSVKDIHAHIVGKRNLEMLIWGDRFIDSATTGYGEWEASANNTTAAIDLIPKDIVICDWHYETSYGGVPATYPSVREFTKKGFRVWPAGWKSAQNAQMLTAVALETASDRMVGYLATTWTSIGAVAGGLRGEKKRLGEDYIAGIVDAIHEGARIAWEGTTQLPKPTEETPAQTEEAKPNPTRAAVDNRTVNA
jgi:hypothetical protein